MFRDTQRWLRGCYPRPRPPWVPGRCSQEWKGTPQRACRSRRAPVSQAASYSDSTALASDDGVLDIGALVVGWQRARHPRFGGPVAWAPPPRLRCESAVRPGISEHPGIPTGLKQEPLRRNWTRLNESRRVRFPLALPIFQQLAASKAQFPLVFGGVCCADEQSAHPSPTQLSCLWLDGGKTARNRLTSPMLAGYS